MGKAWKGLTAKGLGFIPSVMEHRGLQRVPGSDLGFRKVTCIAVWKAGWREAKLDIGLPAKRTLQLNKPLAIEAGEGNVREIEEIF